VNINVKIKYATKDSTTINEINTGFLVKNDGTITFASWNLFYPGFDKNQQITNVVVCGDIRH